MNTDINDLIHTNARSAFKQGVKTERNRILKALEDLTFRDDLDGEVMVAATMEYMTKLINNTVTIMKEDGNHEIREISNEDRN